MMATNRGRYGFPCVWRSTSSGICPRTTQTVKSDWISRPIPKLLKGIVEFLHDALHERAVTDPILNEDHEWFLSKASSVLGFEFIRPIWICRHSHTSPVRC